MLKRKPVVQCMYTEKPRLCCFYHATGYLSEHLQDAYFSDTEKAIAHGRKLNGCTVIDIFNPITNKFDTYYI